MCTKQSCVILAIISILASTCILGCLGSSGGGHTLKSNSTVSGYAFVPEGAAKAKSTSVKPLAVTPPPGMVPLANATVRFTDGSGTTTTDDNGYYIVRVKITSDSTKTVEVLSGDTVMVSFEIEAKIDKATVSSVKIAGTTGNWSLKEVISRVADELEIAEEQVTTVIGATFEFSGIATAIDRETGGEADLTWEAVTHSDTPISYKVYVSETSGEQVFTETPYASFQAVTSGSISSLQNSSYYIVIRAVTASGRIEDTPNTVETDVTLTDKADPTWPTTAGVQAVVMGDEQATVSWNAATDNTTPISYKIYYHTASPATGGEVVTVPTPTVATEHDYQHAITVLTNGTTYYFTIHAVDGADPANEDENTVELTGNPIGIPGVPGNVTAALGYQKIIVNWNAPTDTGGTTITNYNIYRGLSAESTSLIASDVSETTYDDEEDDDYPLDVDTAYYYQVSAVNSVGEGPKSTAVSETFRHVPPAPGNLSASSITTDSYTFTWDDVSGETGYRVYLNGSQHGTDLSADSTSVDIISLSSGTSYSMEVSAFNAAGEGSKSLQIVETLPDAPTNVALSNIEATGFTATWDSVSGDGVDGYRIYLDTTQHGNDITSGNTVEVTGVAPGTTFPVQVSAFTGGEEDELGGEGEKSSPAIDVLTKPSSPSGLTASSITTSGFTLDWTTVSGTVDGYRVYKDGVQFGSDTTETSMDITDLTAGTAYSMEVAAFNGSGESKSGAEEVKTVPDIPESVNAGNISATSFSVSWDAVTGADGYRVYLDSTKYGSDVTSGTSLSISGRSSGTSYSVEVAAYNSSGEGEKSTGIDVLTLPTAPTGLTTDTITTTGFTLTWNGVTGATGFRVYKDSQQEGDDTASTSIAITGLASGTAYSFEVSAYNDTNEGDKSVALDVETLPDAPVDLIVSEITTTSFHLEWDGVSGNTVDGYHVYLNSIKYGSDITGYNTVDVTGLDPATGYSVEVSAFTAGGEGAKSSPVIDVLTIPAAPSGVTANDIKPDGFTVSWDANAGTVDGYRIYIDSSQYGGDITTGTSVEVTGQVPGTYQVEVKAFNTSGEGNQTSINVSINKLEGTVSPSGSIVELWQNWTKIADDENSATDAYLFNNIDLGTYRVRAYKVISDVSGYYLEHEVVVSAGENTQDITAVAIDHAAFDITITDTSCSFYSENSLMLEVGDYIIAKDKVDGVTCGLFIVHTKGEYGLITVYGDETGTPEDEGAEENDIIVFYVNGSTVEVSGDAEFDNGENKEVDLLAPSQ